MAVVAAHELEELQRTRGTSVSSQSQTGSRRQNRLMFLL